MPKETENKERKMKYEIVEIATQTAPTIKDNETGETYDLITILCKIANDVDELKRNLS